MRTNADRRPLQEIAYTSALSELGDRLRVQAFTFQGKVVTFLVQYETMIDGNLVPVVRYDTAHGHPHRDTLDRRGRIVKKDWLPDTTTPAEGWRQGERDLADNWARYKDEFLRSPR